MAFQALAGESVTTELGVMTGEAGVWALADRAMTIAITAAKEAGEKRIAPINGKAPAK
ncbi:hypothetical protein Sbs19_38310 [Sphingobium sp. BS19]|nr:hypothetical protein Sbs19_38310 [Sphingobium sp. BS19]